jgi:hypothetical protein
MDQNDRQVIFVSNPIGHGGNYFAWALQDAMGYDYYILKSGPNRDFTASENNDTTLTLDGNPYWTNSGTIGHNLRLMSFLLDPYKHEIFEREIHNNEIAGADSSNRESKIYDFLIEQVDLMVKYRKFLFLNDIKTVIIQNEHFILMPKIKDNDMLFFITDADSYLKRFNIERFNGNRPQQYLETMIGWFNHIDRNNMNPYHFIINMEDMICNKNYDFIEHLKEKDRVDVDKLHKNMLVWHEFILEKNLNK